jgi:hypothetical protein
MKPGTPYAEEMIALRASQGFKPGPTVDRSGLVA